jgi:hypothetical protein
LFPVLNLFVWQTSSPTLNSRFKALPIVFGR